MVQSQDFMNTASFKETVKEAGAPRMQNSFLCSPPPAELKSFDQSNLLETRDLLMSSTQNQQSMPKPTAQPQQQIKVKLFRIYRKRKSKLIQRLL